MDSILSPDLDNCADEKERSQPPVSDMEVELTLPLDSERNSDGSADRSPSPVAYSSPFSGANSGTHRFDDGNGATPRCIGDLTILDSAEPPMLVDCETGEVIAPKQREVDPEAIREAEAEIKEGGLVIGHAPENPAEEATNEPEQAEDHSEKESWEFSATEDEVQPQVPVEEPALEEDDESFSVSAEPEEHIQPQEQEHTEKQESSVEPQKALEDPEFSVEPEEADQLDASRNENAAQSDEEFSVSLSVQDPVEESVSADDRVEMEPVNSESEHGEPDASHVQSEQKEPETEVTPEPQQQAEEEPECEQEQQPEAQVEEPAQDEAPVEDHTPEPEVMIEAVDDAQEQSQKSEAPQEEQPEEELPEASSVSVSVSGSDAGSTPALQEENTRIEPEIEGPPAAEPADDASLPASDHDVICVEDLIDSPEPSAPEAPVAQEEVSLDSESVSESPAQEDGHLAASDLVAEARSPVESPECDAPPAEDSQSSDFSVEQEDGIQCVIASETDDEANYLAQDEPFDSSLVASRGLASVVAERELSPRRPRRRPASQSQSVLSDQINCPLYATTSRQRVAELQRSRRPDRQTPWRPM